MNKYQKQLAIKMAIADQRNTFDHYITKFLTCKLCNN